MLIYVDIYIYIFKYILYISIFMLPKYAYFREIHIYKNPKHPGPASWIHFAIQKQPSAPQDSSHCPSERVSGRKFSGGATREFSNAVFGSIPVALQDHTSTWPFIAVLDFLYRQDNYTQPFGQKKCIQYIFI